MKPWLRWSLYSSFGVLWLTGCAWLVLHYFFQRTTDFGTGPHPWQPGLLMIHGVLAAVAVFLFGWIAGSHIGGHWKRGVNRVSGILLIALIATLALTGLGGYYLTNESMRIGSAGFHEIAGILAAVPALLHWFVARRPVPAA